MKFIKDNLYGFVELGEIAQKIVDTPEFQRLRFIKQLGFSHFVFPGAHHTRFEHSIGVYHLINVFLDYLSKDYEIDERLKTIIAISGLIHDIGHVAFSHMFDDYIIPLIRRGVEHEHRSIQLFRQINQKYDIGFKEKELQLISKIILGKVDRKYPKFVFQIVANKKNELDLDKLDYLQRDCYYLGRHVSFDYKFLFRYAKIINGEIAFHEKTAFTILSIFNTRYELHKKFYNHKTIILIEVMVKDALIKYAKTVNFTKMFQTNEWLDLLDDVLFNQMLKEPVCSDIIQKIMNRDLYKLIDNKKLTDRNMIRIDKHIGLTGQKTNPMVYINFYEKRNPEVMFNMDMKEISIYDIYHSYEVETFLIERT